MKLLLDENLSRRLAPSLQAVYPGSSQVDLLDLSGANDHAVWTYARAHDFAIVTKDDDYLDLGACQGSCRVSHAATLLISAAAASTAAATPSRSGLSVTAPIGDQSRVLPDQRFGFA